MPIQTDSYFALGKTHTVCQDYAATHNENGSVVLAVSDGCSSSPDTDFGSRFLVRSGIRGVHIQEGFPLDNHSAYAMGVSASNAQESLGLPEECLDATLMLANILDNQVLVNIWGDGVVCATFKDGRRKTWEIRFKDNAPAYLSYLRSERRLERYFKSHGDRTIITTEKGSPESVWSLPVTLENYWVSLNIPVAEVQSVMLFSDGVSSFRRLNSSNSWDAIPLDEVLDQITAVKNPNGEFMVRRMRKFLYDFCHKNNWVHEDDVSVAALMNVE